MRISKNISALAFSLALNANAAALIDTGSPELTQNGAVAVCNNGSWCVQSVALQVTFDQPVSIQSVDAWLWVKNPGDLTVSVYSDYQGLPSLLVESMAYSVSSTERGWKRANGLGWVFHPGTYWAVFSVESGQTFDGALEFPAPIRLPVAINNNYIGGWGNAEGGAGGGLRIYADTLQAVPEPSFLAMAFAGAIALMVISRAYGCLPGFSRHSNPALSTCTCRAVSAP